MYPLTLRILNWLRLLTLLTVLTLALLLVFTVSLLTGEAADPESSRDVRAAAAAEAVETIAELPTVTIEPTLEQDIEPVYELTEDERELVERVVMAESGNQSLEGQMAVAQCILNTCAATGQRPTEVVYAPGQYADPADSETVTESVRGAVAAVFDLGETVTTEQIRYFYNPAYGTSSWHETALTYVTTIGDHRFFAEPDAPRNG